MAVVIGIFVTLFAGQHRKLNVTGKVEFALDTLHVLLLLDVVLEFGEHVRERPREFGHFIAALNFGNRHVKISASKLAGSKGKVLERLCHAERNQQDDDKNDSVTAKRQCEEQLTHRALVLEIFLDGPHDHEGPVGRMDRRVVNGRFFAAGNRTDEEPAAIPALKLNGAISTDFLDNNVTVPLALGNTSRISHSLVLGRCNQSVSRV